MGTKKDTEKSAKSTEINKKARGFTDEEKAAMKNRAQELKAESAREKNKEEGESAALAAIAAMQEPDRSIASGSTRSSKTGTRPPAENLVWNARLCQPGWQGRLLLPNRAEVQHEILDVRL